MRLLQRYILIELLKVFTFLLSVLTILLVFVGVFREVSESGLGPLQVMQILPFIVPSLLPFTIPATLLLSVCVVYGRIAGDQEVTAAKAAGINVMSLLWPSFLLGTVLSIGSLFLTDQVIPWAVGNIQKIVASAVEDIFLDLLRSNHQVTNEQRGFSITVMDVDDKTLIKPTFQYAPRGRSTITVQAAEANIEFDLEAQEVILHLRDGHIDIPGSRRVWFDRESYPFPMPQEIAKPKPRHMGINKIYRKMNGVKSTVDAQREAHEIEIVMALTLGDFDRMLEDDFRMFQRNQEFQLVDYHKMKTEIHSRFAMSTSCFFFVLIGGPYAILQGRRQFLTSFFMCFLPILLIYYPVALLMMNLSKNGKIDPTWAMWIGNAILLVAGIRVLTKVVRH